MAFLLRFWRKAFFSEINPVIELGAKRNLQAEDLPALPPELDPINETIPEAAIDWSSGPALMNSLLRASLKFMAWPMLFYMGNAALNLCGPVLVNRFVTRLQNGIGDGAAMTEALLYGLCIGVSGIIAGLCIQHYFYGSLRRFQITVNVLNTKIFRHSLALSKSAREKIAVGDIVNHMSTDTDSVSEMGNAVSDLIYCALMIAGAIGLLFYYIGDTAWVAVVLLGLLVPITKKVSADFTRFDEDLMKRRDARVSLMAQMLSAVRLVKYFGWEKSVGAEIGEIRTAELASRRRIAGAELLTTLVYVSVGTFVLFSVLAVHTWRGGHLDAALVFTCVSLFVLLEDPFAFISRVISMYINAKVGAERIAKFVAQPTVEPDAEGVSASGPGATAPVGFVMDGLNVHVGENHHWALKDLQLSLRAGESLAVVGTVGAGKSTFIHALLGELPASSGEIYFTDQQGGRHESVRIGYVPQEAYIINGPLKENLMFGNEGVTDADIDHAIEVAGLRQDMQLMQGGWRTEIGEKGINLSGGQRQRISLARAILHRPQLVVLDDPLSAVDPAMEAHLAERLLFGEWSNITRVVITHRLNHLRDFDRIAFLRAGELIACGTFGELEQSCADFREYLDEYALSKTGEVEKKALPERSALGGEGSRITDDEDREYGAVSGGVYRDYILSLGGEGRWRPLILVGLALAAASGTVFPLLQKTWLAYVSNIQSGEAAGTMPWLAQLAHGPSTAIYVYGGLGLLVLIATLAADFFWLKRGLAAGRDIHDNMLKSVLNANVRFYDSTPVGRVLQRFSRDMESIDIQLQWSFEHSMRCLAQVVITLALIVSILPWILLVIAPVLFIYYRVQKLYRVSAREAKRLDSISRSPRYAHFKETLQGLSVIRAFGKREWFLSEFYSRLAHNQRMFHGHYMINRWFSSRIPLVGGLVSLCTAVGIVLSVRYANLSPGLAGLLTVYSLSFWGVLNWGIRIWSEVEARMTSMERVKFYSKLPQEVSVTKPTADVIGEWPLRGEVRFENVVARYAPHLPQVLKGLSFQVRAGEKAGIIGRTGSGKSTLFQTMYRFLELESGRILIDGVDIASIPLNRLRKALAIIPQDPTLFMGSLRRNLDRDTEFTDAEIWSVLDRTCLGDVVRALPAGLKTELTENGANFSQGQRQLLCLARALLMRARVVILDEATASVDVKTDALVQRVIRESCEGVTMLIIAHRLGTVRDCDQVLEISEGTLARRIAKTGLAGPDFGESPLMA